MSLHDALRGGVKAVFQRCEDIFDASFRGAANPLRHLGALGFYFFWIISVSGLYLFIVLDTGVTQVYESIRYFTHDQWYAGGILRSFHRYASDAFLLVMGLHLLREWAYDRYYGFRWFSWITGIPLIWLAYISGIGGYWITWDRLAQFSAVASAELLDWLPIFGEPIIRNFVTPEAMNDRFFTLLVFIHLGVPLLLLLALWVHVQRVSRVDYFPARPLALGTLATLLVLSLIHPAASDAPADLGTVPTELRLDWLVLFVHPLTYATSPAAAWSVLGALTLLLLVLPFLPHPAAQPIAEVSPANCNGCSRCFADCPYAAVVMESHPDKPGHKLARVLPDLCASCGICAGSCPSSTPFRSVEDLITGIDMPQQPVSALRREMEAQLAHLAGTPKIVVFGCDQGFDVRQLADGGTAAFSLICAGMLPPSFVEYALRAGADGVFVTGCRTDGCLYRLGNTWAEQRLHGTREPHLRSNVPAQRLHIQWGDSLDAIRLTAGLTEFRKQLEALGAAQRPKQFTRRTARHG
jgi:coenzyme F420-reducing hydrogenase delta subunit/ferredoxin